jgi:hypothetical protein
MQKQLVILLFALSSSLFAPQNCGAQDYYTPPSRFRQPVAHNSQDSMRQTHVQQSTQKPFFFSFNAGLSFPVKDFGNKDTAKNFMVIGPDSTNAKGFANVGFHIAVSGGYFLTPNFGVLAKFGYNYNTFNASALNNIINGYYYYDIDGSFSIWQAMGGLFGNFQLSHNASFWVQGMIGTMYANFPSFSILLGPESINGSLPHSSTLAYSGGIGFEFVITPITSFNINLSYTSSGVIYPTFSYTYLGTYPGWPPNGYTYKQNTAVTMNYGDIDLTIGLLFHL